MLTPWKKSYDQPREHIQKQRLYFANKGPSSQGYGFPSSYVCMWELDCEESEHQRIDAFELWCWRRLLRVPWSARRSNQSILKEISPGCLLEGLMLKLKLQYFDHLMQKVTHWKRPWCWEGLGAGGKGDDRGWDGLMASPTRWTWVWVNSGSWWWTGRPGVLWFMGSQRVRHKWVTKLNWKEISSVGVRTCCYSSISSSWIPSWEASQVNSFIHSLVIFPHPWSLLRKSAECTII